MKLPAESFERTVLVRSEAESDPAYGVDPEKRSMQDLLSYGLVVVNKQQGPTSHQFADTVKKVLHVDKAGHSGTLDPNVTGVLVLALANATRVVDVLLKAGKEYVCVLYLHDDVAEEKVRETLASFMGTITQMPPQKSAVKRVLRDREIYYIDILEIEGRRVLFRVGCQAGTYIRKLCTDAAEKMGIKGHMQELVRTKVGQFQDSSWHSLHDLADAYSLWKEKGDETVLRQCILPMERAVLHIPKIWLFDSAVDSVCHGAFLSAPGISQLESGIAVGDQVALLTLKGELIALGVSKMNSQNLLRQEKGVAVGNTRVFMQRGVYPKYEASKDSD